MAMTEADGGYTADTAERAMHEPADTADGRRRADGIAARPDAWRGLLLSVAGADGAGSSLLAMCLAAELAGDASNRGLVLLADLAVGADQAAMHGCRGVAPPMLEFAEACDGGRRGTNALRSMVLEPAGRNYHLLLGPRHHRDTTADQHRRTQAVLDSLLSSYRFVVADVDADVDGLSDTDSARAADHDGLAQATLLRSDLIVVVGTGDTPGLYSLVRTIDALAGLRGASRIVPVVNRLPRGVKRRSVAAGAVIRLLKTSAAFEAGDPVLVAERSIAGSAILDGLAPPPSLVRPLAAEVRVRLLAANASRSRDETA